MAEESLPKSLERYDVLERIAVGGMAEVFLAKAYGVNVGFKNSKDYNEWHEARVTLGTDPYRGSPHGTQRFALPLGDLGIIVYMLLEDENAVAVIDLVWTG